MKARRRRTRTRIGCKTVSIVNPTFLLQPDKLTMTLEVWYFCAKVLVLAEKHEAGVYGLTGSP